MRTSQIYFESLNEFVGTAIGLSTVAAVTGATIIGTIQLYRKEWVKQCMNVTDNKVLPRNYIPASDWDYTNMKCEMGVKAKVIKALKSSKSKCSKARDPKKCSQQVDARIKKLEQDLKDDIANFKHHANRGYMDVEVQDKNGNRVRIIKRR